jgi:hypothetical protein
MRTDLSRLDAPPYFNADRYWAISRLKRLTRTLIVPILASRAEFPVSTIERHLRRSTKIDERFLRTVWQ